MNPSRRTALGAALAFAALAATSGGCSWLPFRSGPTGPDAGADSLFVADSTLAADSTRAADSTLVADSAFAAGPAATGRDALDSAGTAAPPAPAVAPPPAPDPDASDQVTVQISDTERAELENRARESLREARRVIRAIDRTALTTERLDKLTTAESLVEAARAALDADVRAAATLAHKASVLLAELTTN